MSTDSHVSCKGAYCLKKVIAALLTITLIAILYYVKQAPEMTISAQDHIPHIIHQMWKQENVYLQLTPWIRSWIIYNPQWEYWFWTDKEIERFMALHYPEYLHLYNNYGDDFLRKSDAVRYFILYHYGGVYADLDMECLKPLDNWTHHQCIIPQETYEHSYLLYNKGEPNLINCFMACLPTHPYFKVLIENLETTQHEDEALYSTGPFYMTSVYKNFTRKSLQANVTATEKNITVVPPVYFTPSYDSNNKEVNESCHMIYEDALPLQQWMCDNLDRPNIPFNDSYANHHWFHTIWNPDVRGLDDSTNIQNVIPKTNLKIVKF